MKLQNAFFVLLALPGVLAGCSDYDLARNTDQKTPIEDTGDLPDPENPDIRVSPASLDFGTLARDCISEAQEVTIRNVGGATLEVYDIGIPSSGSSNFDMDYHLPVLEPGTEYTFTITFTPSAYTTYNVDIEVESNDPDGVVSVAATGIGGEDSLYEEVFDQDYHSEVDVLWVIDNSCSMSGALGQVEDNFDSFIDQFVDLGLDFHLGVTTTDMVDASHSGRLQGSPTVIDSSHPDPKGAFMDAVTLGSGGSATEQGFAATKAALTAPLTSGANSGFLRGDSVALATIVVSDEEEQSTNLDPGNFSSWYNGLKSDPDKATFSAICGDRGISICTLYTTNGIIMAAGGDDYIDAAANTGGIWQSICTDHFDLALQHLSLTAAGMSYYWDLTEVPSNIALMTVEVDGVEVDYSGIDGWTYESSTNRIVFHGDGIPGPGARITVSYPLDSEC